jgi:hypothetical protein
MPSKSVPQNPYYNIKVRYHLSVFVCISENKRIMVVTGYEQGLRYFEESNPKKQFDKVWEIVHKIMIDR